MMSFCLCYGIVFDKTVEDNSEAGEFWEKTEAVVLVISNKIITEDDKKGEQ